MFPDLVLGALRLDFLFMKFRRVYAGEMIISKQLTSMMYFVLDYKVQEDAAS